MTLIRFQRRPRKAAPRVPGGEVTLQPPPEIPRTTPGSLLQKMMPVVMVVAMVGMVAFMFANGGVGSNPSSLLFPVMMAFSMVGMFTGQGGKGAKAAEINEDRKDYLRYLDGLRKDVARTEETMRRSMLWVHPDPKLIWTLAGTRRMWERSPGDKDFCHVRVGLGEQRLATRLASPETGPVEELEPIASISLRRFVRTYSLIPRLPSAVALFGFPAIGVEGNPKDSRDMVRAMLVQLCMFHGPDHVLLAVVCGPDTEREWDWVKWLPHNQHPDTKDGVGSERMLYGSIRDMNSSLHSVIGSRNPYQRSETKKGVVQQVIIVVDGGVLTTDEGDRLRTTGIDGVLLLDMSNFAPMPTGTKGLRLFVQHGKVGARSLATLDAFGEIDRINPKEAEKVARRLARYRAPTQRAGGENQAGEVERITSWAQMMNISDIGAFNPDVHWKRRTGPDRLRVAFGLGADGTPVELDIKEAAENGMGPHGLCIGATGSGKSEFLRTLVLGMMATHSPDQLNFVLIDFKGGATFLGLGDAPHVSAVITNLEGEGSLVARMKDALEGEMQRRQQVLASAGATPFVNVTEYENARAQGANLPPLPALFIVIDEFSELLSQHQEFAEVFVMIGRLGRSLHVHLLLASQRLDEGKLKGLESHLSYRIGLKTFSATESRAVIGVTDAYHLPAMPGAGYLKSDGDGVVRFQAGYVSGPYTGEVTRSKATSGEAVEKAESRVTVRPFTAAQVPFQASDYVVIEPEVVEQETEKEDGPSISNMAMLVERIKGRGREARQIWLPPLDFAPTLNGESDPPMVPRSILTGEVASVSHLQATIGIIDRPFEQKRDQLVIDLSAGLGNVAVVGGPQSGKSTALRTIIMSLALTHTPEQVQFYCIDLGGGTMAGLTGLPHVGSVAGRMEPDLVRRTLSEVTTIIRQREIAFRQLGIEQMSQFRQLRAQDPRSSAGAAGVAQDPFGDVFLVIDGYGNIRQEFEPLEQQIINLAGQGLSYGVHLMLGVARWAELKPAIKDQLGTRLELRQGDPGDSIYGRKVADLVPEARPGRGVIAGGLHTMMALPRVDGKSDPADLSDGVADAVARITAANRWRPAPRVRMLPERFPREELIAAAPEWTASIGHQRVLHFPFALNEEELAPVYVNFAEHPHFLIFGDIECGKTMVLRNIADGIVHGNEARDGAIFMVDYNRSMLGVIPEKYLLAYCSNAQMVAAKIGGLVALLQQRMPGPDVTPQQLRERSWWSGPEVFLLIDDYDLVATPNGNPLMPILEYLPQAKDLGLHVVLARRSGGAGRALFESIISRLRDLASPGLIMSGSKDEGYLLGSVRPSAMPPGRGTVVSRSGTGLVQVAWMPPLVD